MNADFRLRDLPLGFRVGLTGVLGAIVLGLWASLEHLREHHHNRDGRPGVSVDDLAGAYHGLDNPAPLVVVLERGHPESQPAANRELLLKWLRSAKVSDDFDNPDLGDAAPAEVLARDCMECHGRKATAGDGIGQTVPLDYWDDVEKVAFARKLDPTPESILITSTHTHALSMAVVSCVLMFLAWWTRFASWMKSGIALLLGLGLACDLAGWWLARESTVFVGLVIAGGGAWVAGAAFACLLALAELWLPRKA
jgi:hypothetical protein